MKMNRILSMATVILALTGLARADLIEVDQMSETKSASLVKLNENGQHISDGYYRILKMNTNQEGDVTHFTFTEGKEGVRCLPGHRCIPHVSRFELSEVKDDADCGSVKYVAREVVDTTTPMLNPERVMEVVDNTDRICQDARPFVWQVTLQTPKGMCLPDFRTDYFGGNPQAY
jgi:hypothetical protein